MLDWVAEQILSLLSAVPPLFGADPHHFTAIRAMVALALISGYVVYVTLQMWPFHSLIARNVDWVRKQLARRQ